MRDNRHAIVEAISADFGHRSSHETLMLEVTPFLASIRQCLQHVHRWMRPQRRHIDRLTFGLARNEVIPQPLGVVGVIVPWNFPLLLSMVPLANIFAAGNRAMVKMSENSRHLAALLMNCVPQYFPPEKLQFFDETGGVGIEFSRLPFDHLMFTGSGATGRAVMSAAAQNLCPVTLELGGKSPAVVCDDFELEVAAERILFAKFTNAGQICTTVDHAYLPEGKVAAFVDLARGIGPAATAGSTRRTTPASSAARRTAGWSGRSTRRAPVGHRSYRCCPVRRSTRRGTASRPTSWSARLATRN